MSQQEDRILPDRLLEDLLRRRREDGRPLGGPLCGDPEMLAAFAEDALTDKARGEMESHLAACSACREAVADRKSTRLNSSHIQKSRMPSSA